MRSRLVAGGTGRLVLDRLSDPVTGDYQNTATVTGSLSDDTGVLAGLGNLTLAYVAGTDGRYVATIPANTTAGLLVNDLVDAEVWAVLPDGATVPFRQRIRVTATSGPA